MAPKTKHGNETCTKRETWQLRMNIDQNNGAIHIYLNIYILGTIEALWDFGDKQWGQNPLGSLFSPKYKISGKYELNQYSDQYSDVIAEFHVLCLFHCRALFLAPFFTPL